jgi:hypothetical protein
MERCVCIVQHACRGALSSLPTGEADSFIYCYSSTSASRLEGNKRVSQTGPLKSHCIYYRLYRGISTIASLAAFLGCASLFVGLRRRASRSESKGNTDWLGSLKALSSCCCVYIYLRKQPLSNLHSTHPILNK